MQTQISTGCDYINLIENNELMTAKIRRLRNYHACTFKDAADKSLLLSGLYQKRKELAELKTCRTVEIIQKLISKIVDDFFEIKNSEITRLISKDNKKDNIDVFFNYMKEDDLRTLEIMTEEVMVFHISNRFAFASKNPEIKLESVEIAHLHQSLNLVREWLYTKNTSCCLAEQLTKLSNRVWITAVKEVISGIPALVLEESNLGNILMKSAGVDYQKEQYELYTGLIERILCILNGFKLQIKQELCQKAAEMIYYIHDKWINEKFDERAFASLETVRFINKAERA